MSLDFSHELNKGEGRWGNVGHPVAVFEAYLEWDEKDPTAKELREAAHTTSDFATYLDASIRKRFFEAYREYRTNWRQYVSTMPLSDFKEVTHTGLSELDDLEVVEEENEYKRSAMGELPGPVIQLRTFGKLLAISRQTLINDDFGKMREAPTKMARAAARTLAKDVISILEGNGTSYDGNPIYDAAHGNLETDALSEAALQAAITNMRLQTNQNGEPTELEPNDLIVPVGLEFTARRLLESSRIEAPEGEGVANLTANIVNLIVEKRLTDPNDWYLQARIDGTDELPGILAGFLNGMEEPQMLRRTEAQMMGAGAFDPYRMDIDHVEWKIRHDWDIAPGEWRAVHKNAVA